MVNAWWEAESGQRFWMETLRRRDIGNAIQAPHRRADNTRTAYYELVEHVRDGDVILHWDANRSGSSAFVAWSVVDGSPYETGNVVYANGAPTNGTEALLRDFTPLDEPLTLPSLVERIDAIRDVRDDVSARHPGPVYFPFDFRKNGTLRAHEGGYLTKFPLELFSVLPELGSARDRATKDERSLDGHVEGSSETRTGRRQAREAGYIADAKVRRAIEMRAVDMATEHYSPEFDVEDVGASRAYDLHLVHRTTGAERRVEVKGSTGNASAVELTHGEVANAREFQPTDLFVVSGIEWERDGDRVRAWGGAARICREWEPLESSLTAIRFRHQVPAATEL